MLAPASRADSGDFRVGGAAAGASVCVSVFFDEVASREAAPDCRRPARLFPTPGHVWEAGAQVLAVISER